MIDSYYPAVESSLETETSKWPVVINNTRIYTNGYVLGAPAHSQLYTAHPQQNISGTADWLPFLWSHELRHIVQNEKMIRGFTAFAAWVAGEYGANGMANFALPRWVWEGDAVLTETLLSSAGRGRSADFDRGLRTGLLSGERFSYSAAAQGSAASYVSRVPSYYAGGYFLCTYIRKEFGIEAFNQILEISADFSFVPLILNIAVLNVTGRSISSIYEDCMDELEALWSEQLAVTEQTATVNLKSSSDEGYTSYYPLGDYGTGIAAVKTSAAAGVELVEIAEDGSETRLRRIGPADLNISFNGETFCWAETVKDVRWGNRSWSAVRVYNPDKKIYRLITKKTRYMSPSISPDGSRIAAVELTEELDSYIVILNTESGEVISRFAEPPGAAPSQTCWSDDGRAVVYVRQNDWMKSLQILYPESGINNRLTEPSVFNISDPAVSDGTVFYISEQTGIENIYTVSADSIEQQGKPLVARPFGTASPAPAGDRLYFADYSKDGFSAVFVEHKSLNTTYAAESAHIDYFKPVSDQEPAAGMAGPGKNPAAVAAADYRIKDYYPALGIFNFHSRTIGAPFSGSGLTFGLKADGIMNDSSSTLYTGYDSGSNELLIGTSGAYAGFYPVLLYGAELQTPLTAAGAIFDSVLYGGFWLPFDFSRGALNHTLGLQAIYLRESRVYPYAFSASAFRASADYTLTADSAKRDLIPPLGLAVSGYWYKSLDLNIYSFLFGESVFYLPGFNNNHGIKLAVQANWNADSADRVYRPEALPRGLDTADFIEPVIINASFDYMIPLFYPDLSIGNIIYIPRLFMSGFLDTAYIKSTKSFQQTTGLEFYTDFNLINHYYPFRAGLRIIYNIVNGRIRFEDTSIGIGIDLM